MNSSLDINSPKGQVFAADQMVAASIVARNSDDGTQFVHSKNAGERAAAPVDAIATLDGFVVAVCEIKTRPDMTRDILFGEFKGEWLITYRKIKELAEASRLFMVPGFGFLYLKPEGIVMGVQLTSAFGGIVCPHRVAMTTTQATCNGGSAYRENAFVNMEKAKAYQ